MKKILFAFSLLVIIFTPLKTFAFDDVTETSPYYDAVTYLGDQGIITTSNQNFNIYGSLNRAELAKVALLGGNIDIQLANTHPFSDIQNQNNWEYNIIYTAKNNKIVNGYEDGTFKPWNYVTQIEALKIILESLNNNIPEATTDLYTDVKKTDWWAKYIAFAIEKNLIEAPQGATFGINQLFPRNMMAQVIYRNLLMNTYNAQRFDPILASTGALENSNTDLTNTALEDINDFDLDFTF